MVSNACPKVCPKFKIARSPFSFSSFDTTSALISIDLFIALSIALFIELFIAPFIELFIALFIALFIRNFYSTFY